ncbi:hypothetical protein ACLOJK_027433 [Asimina triloba]
MLSSLDPTNIQRQPSSGGPSFADRRWQPQIESDFSNRAKSGNRKNFRLQIHRGQSSSLRSGSHGDRRAEAANPPGPDLKSSKQGGFSFMFGSSILFKLMVTAIMESAAMDGKNIKRTTDHHSKSIWAARRCAGQPWQSSSSPDRRHSSINPFLIWQ